MTDTAISPESIAGAGVILPGSGGAAQHDITLPHDIAVDGWTQRSIW